MASRARIGVVSDTHGPLPQEVFDLFNGCWTAEKLRERITRCCRVAFDEHGGVSLAEVLPDESVTVDSRACDLILHAGDIGVQSVLDELGAIAKTVAVLGNNDRTPYWCSDGEVRLFRSLTFDGVDIALQHTPADLKASLHGKPPLIKPCVSTMPDLAVHGHTHVPHIGLDGDCIVLCPGSPTQSRRGSGHHAALVDLHDGHLDEIAFVTLE